MQLQLLHVIGRQWIVFEAFLDPPFIPDDQVIGAAEDHDVVGDAGDFATDADGTFANRDWKSYQTGNG